jgi:hypothetical protein
MFTFLRNVKKAADFFSINQDGVSFLTEQRLKDIEASVSKLPRAIEDRTLTRIINLEYNIYKLERTIEIIQEKLYKEQGPLQLALPVEQTKTSRKRKDIKLQAVEEQIKTVKSRLTWAEVKRLFKYRDGELYWKVKPSKNVRKGNKAGSINIKGYKQVGIGHNTYVYGRIIFLMFHGYLPECVSYIDANPLNTRIENLRAATQSQVTCYSKKQKNNVSGYKGVYLNKQKGKYSAQIWKKGKNHHLGLFKTPKEAYKAYCMAAKKLHGEFARVA